MNKISDKAKLITLIAGIITIIVFITGIQNLEKLIKIFGFSKSLNEIISTKTINKKSTEQKKNVIAEQKKNVKKVNNRRHRDIYRWDFNSGDLRGLKLAGVYLKRLNEKNLCLEIPYVGASEKRYIRITKYVSIPWIFKFLLYIKNPKTIDIIFTDFINSFTIQIFAGKVIRFYEGKDFIFEDLLGNLENWIKWTVQVEEKGMVLLYINDKEFFKYYLRNFDGNIKNIYIEVNPKDIYDSKRKTFDFKSGGFQIDNLSIKGIIKDN